MLVRLLRGGEARREEGTRALRPIETGRRVKKKKRIKLRGEAVTRLRLMLLGRIPEDI